MEIIVIYLRIVIGVTLSASAVAVFYEPNTVVTGGVSGLCIITSAYINEWFNISVPLSLLNIVFNLPLLAVGYFVLGKSFISRTVFATVCFSIALEITSYLPVYKGDIILVAVYGGVLMGVGIGLTMRSFATTGGSDLFGAITHKLRRSVSVANAMFAFDAVVIALGFLLFGVEVGLYAIISVYIASHVVDGILEGLNFSVCAFIISKESELISKGIMEELDRGVTGLNGKGMFTKNELNVLMCIVAKKEMLALKKIVNNKDPNAFMVISHVKEALGEGFGAY